MAISEDRLKIAEVTKSTVSNFQSRVDKPFESLESLQNAANAINSNIEGTINGFMSGFESKATSFLDKFIPKNLSLNTNQLGFFENILCGKLPSLDLRLPKFKMDMFKDINFSFDVTICGKSKQVNPIDAALSIVDKLRNSGNLFAGRAGLNQLIESALRNKLSDLGIMGLPDCILDSSRWGSRSYGDPLGGSLYNKMLVNDMLGVNGCAGDILRSLGLNEGINKVVMSNIFSKLSGADATMAYNALLKLMGSDPLGASYGMSSVLGSANNPYVWNQMGMAYNGYSNQNDVDFLKILNFDQSSLLGVNPNISNNELVNLRTDSSNMFSNLSNSNINYNDPASGLKQVIMTANLVDPNWNKDNEGNISLYKTRNNSTLANLSNSYLQSNIGSKYKDPLTGVYTTNLDAIQQISVVNSFKEEPRVRV